MGIAHFEEARTRDLRVGHLAATWSLLGEAAESVRVGLRRIQIDAGGWSTPVHAHGREEEIFYVLSGRGLSWQSGRTTEVATGDCIVHLAQGPAHSLHALEPLDVLAFGTRDDDESPRFPRLGRSLVGGRWVQSGEPRVDRFPVQFVAEAEIGPPDLPEPEAILPGVARFDDVAADDLHRPRVARRRRNLGVAAGSLISGLQHVEVEPGMLSAPQHCHSVEEEMFVVLDGAGHLLLGDEEIAVRPGHVVSRPAGTGVAHTFRGGPTGLTYLAYGNRDPADICFYPRSGKIAWRGVGVVGRVEQLDYWDGEEEP